MRYVCIFAALRLSLILSAAAVCAQTQLTYTKAGSYWMVERSDLRRYDNGKYTGLTSREVRSFVYPSDYLSGKACGDAAIVFEGGFYVGEKTVSNLKETALSLDTSVPARFCISQDGRLTALEDNGFPTFRSFPSFPAEAVNIGESWTSDAVRAVDPLNKGIYTRMPMKVLYTFQGEEIYKGKNTYRIKAAWATRYGRFYTDPHGDPDLLSASGSHSADMYILRDTGQAFVIADRVDEQFVYADGKRVEFKGNILLFTDFPSAVEKNGLLPLAEKIVHNEQKAHILNEHNPEANSRDGFALPQNEQSSNFIDIQNDTVIEQTPAGLRFSLRNIRFLPDSTDFEAEETERLNLIALALKKVPGAKLLIEGHAASTGKPEGEKKLSGERARRIADELTLRGIPAESFITRGHGSERPLASNETDEGKRINRRVEITVLE